jgi:hypothetical protein
MDIFRHAMALAILCPLAVAGCGGIESGMMLPGTLLTDDGKTISFEIERARRAGSMTGLDLSTGEKFSGSYVGIIGGTNAVAYAPGAGFAFGGARSNIANATAFMRGDKGTILTCEMQIEAGLFPHGIGQCKDNRAITYHLQF